MTARFVKRPDYLSQGESARLIPVGSETSGERSATSVLLAVFMAVEEYGKRMLQSVGAPAKKSAKISCLTEVVFKQAPDIKKFRPDGLIIVSMGSCKFTALVEAKTGNAELKPEQIEAYLDIARQNSIDAVVTISNQFAPLPSHHPVSVSKHKTRTVQLFHWSWQSLFSEAV